MRRSTAPAVLLALVLAGCAGDALTGPPADASAFEGVLASNRVAPERPIKGDCEAETIEVQPISAEVIRRVSIGTCQLSHLGRTALLSIAYSNLVTFHQVGEHTFTAANGDQLYATSAGSGSFTPPSTLHFTGVTTIHGGTGRFAQATGVMQVVGVQNMAVLRTFLSYDGWIAY
jgi:hypothetical protein